MDELTKTICDVVAQVAADEPGRLTEIRPEQKLVDDVGLESLDLARLVAKLDLALGADPFVRGNHAQARINRTLGILIRNAVDGEAMTTENGDKLNVQVSREFIKSYSPLKLATTT